MIEMDQLDRDDRGSIFSSISTSLERKKQRKKEDSARRDSLSPENASLLEEDDRASYTTVPLNTPSHRAKRWHQQDRLKRFVEDDLENDDGGGERKGNVFEDQEYGKREMKQSTRKNRRKKDWRKGYQTAKEEWEREHLTDSVCMKLCGCFAYFVYQFVIGTAPGFLRLFEDFALLDFLVNVVLRSIGQVAFCNNPWSGILIIIACFIDYDNMLGPGIYGICCVVVANLTALLLALDKGLIRNGLFGFNAFLIGIGVAVFLESGSGEWIPDYPIIFGIVSCGIASIFVQLCVSKFLGTVGPLPCLTLPFNIMLILFLFDAERQFSVRTVNTALIHPSQISIVSAPKNQTEFLGANLPEGLFKGLSEIFVINNVVSSVFIAAAILIYSRMAFGLALTGSMIGIIASVALGSNNHNVKIGLWGYNPALTMMAIGGVFVVPSVESTIIAAIACFFTQIIWAGQVQLFAPWGLPVCTFPFCFATLTFMFIRPDVSKRFRYVPLADITTPEEHYSKLGRQEVHSGDDEDDDTGI